MNALELANKIISHGDVQRAGSQRPTSTKMGDLPTRLTHWQSCQTDGMRRLYRAKTARRCRTQAIHNAKEEAPYAAKCEEVYGPGAAYDAGYAVRTPQGPNILKAIREAVESGGLTAAVAAMCNTCLGVAE